MTITTLDGRAFSRFVAAGTYFLRKYRGVVDDLNVFPVPDGDTGSNMYLTARAALAAAHKVRSEPLSVVAAAAAQGSLLGARGNSGVIFSQMMRGFAHTVRHRETIDTFQLSVAMKDAVVAARSALRKPVEGTIITVAGAAADEAYALAVREPDFYRLVTKTVRAANEALERTPEQLPALKEAGVVDSGGAGFCYFLEGILHFLPDSSARATAFPRRPDRKHVFTKKQSVGENRFCTEFVLEHADVEATLLRELLERKGDSLIVAGGKPTLKVHIHCADPAAVRALVAKHGTIAREKVENMEQQHHKLVVETPVKPVAVVAIVPGDGFAGIARELGADMIVSTMAGTNPSVRDLLVAINAAHGERVVLLVNDPNVRLAAAEAANLTDIPVVVVPTRDVIGGLAVQLELANGAAIDREALLAASAHVRSASVFFAGKASAVGGVAIAKGAPTADIAGTLVTGTVLADVVAETVRLLGGEDGGLVTLYYGGAQKERDAQRLAALLGERFAEITVEYYYGGQSASQFLVSFER
jgi:DAK2 domain fusion protein YloV